MNKSIFNRIQSALWNNKGESYVDTGVKMLIAIVIGALLLTGIYAITRDVVLENVESQISDFFDQTPTLNGGSGGGNGSGGSDGGNEPVLAATFADNSWDDIAYACQNDMIPDTWNIGDIKTMTIGENEVEIVIIDKNHDEYADGGVAPLTFMTKQVIGNHVMNTEWTNAGGWDGSTMYAYLNGELLDSLEYKDSIKAVKKTTHIGKADSGDSASMEVRVSCDKLFLLSQIEVFGTRATDVHTLEGYKYDYFSNANSILLKNLSGDTSHWWLRSTRSVDKGFYAVNPYSSFYALDSGNVCGVAFAFCF